MGILKKLSAMLNRQGHGSGKKLVIDKLLASDNINNSIIEIDDFVCALCSWGDDLEKLTTPQKTFYFNQNLEREVNNGGFSQYFFNGSGNFAHETIISLKAISADKTADILQRAINYFPGKTVPEDRLQRQEILELIDEDVWEPLDQQFFLYEDNLNDLNMEYIRQNKSAF